MFQIATTQHIDGVLSLMGSRSFILLTGGFYLLALASLADVL